MHLAAQADRRLAPIPTVALRQKLQNLPAQMKPLIDWGPKRAPLHLTARAKLMLRKAERTQVASKAPAFAAQAIAWVAAMMLQAQVARLIDWEPKAQPQAEVAQALVLHLLARTLPRALLGQRKLPAE